MHSQLANTFWNCISTNFFSTDRKGMFTCCKLFKDLPHISFVYYMFILYSVDFKSTFVFCSEFLSKILVWWQDHRHIRVPSSIQPKTLWKELQKQWSKVIVLVLKLGGHQHWYQITNITRLYINLDVSS